MSNEVTVIGHDNVKKLKKNERDLMLRVISEY